LNVALPASPVVPVTVTMYEPFVPVATVNDPDIMPLDTIHNGFEIRPPGEDDIVQLVSAAAKFEPVTRTGVPGRPEDGNNETAGVTVRVAVPLSSMGMPSTITGTEPGGRLPGTLKAPVTTPLFMLQLAPVTIIQGWSRLHPIMILQLVSFRLKFVPMTPIDALRRALSGDSMIVGRSTVNVSSREPCAMMVLFPNLIV